MTVKSNIATEGKQAPFAKELGDRELDMVVGGLNPQPLPPRQFKY
jgi:hypothetical protein